jgi:hypothetical protein
MRRQKTILSLLCMRLHHPVSHGGVHPVAWLGWPRQRRRTDGRTRWRACHAIPYVCVKGTPSSVSKRVRAAAVAVATAMCHFYSKSAVGRSSHCSREPETRSISWLGTAVCRSISVASCRLSRWPDGWWRSDHAGRAAADAFAALSTCCRTAAGVSGRCGAHRISVFGRGAAPQDNINWR